MYTQGWYCSRSYLVCLLGKQAHGQLPIVCTVHTILKCTVLVLYLYCTSSTSSRTENSRNLLGLHGSITAVGHGQQDCCLSYPRAHITTGHRSTDRGAADI